MLIKEDTIVYKSLHIMQVMLSVLVCMHDSLITYHPDSPGKGSKQDVTAYNNNNKYLFISMELLH